MYRDQTVINFGKINIAFVKMELKCDKVNETFEVYLNFWPDCVLALTIQALN